MDVERVKSGRRMFELPREPALSDMMTPEPESDSPSSPESTLEDLLEAASPPHQSPSNSIEGYSTLTVAIDCLIRRRQRNRLRTNFQRRGATVLPDGATWGPTGDRPFLIIVPARFPKERALRPDVAPNDRFALPTILGEGSFGRTSNITVLRDGRAAIVNHACRYAGCDPSTGKSIILPQDVNTYVVRIGYQTETLRRGIGGPERYWHFSEILYAHPDWTMSEEMTTSAVQTAGEEAAQLSSPHVAASAEGPAFPASSYSGPSTISIQSGSRKRTRLELDDGTSSGSSVQISVNGFTEVTVVSKMRRATVHVDDMEQHTQPEADTAV